MPREPTKLIATYDTLLQYKNSRTNYVLALSEFIDNSISSYKKTYNTLNGLSINILFDFSNSNNWKLTIEDNAGGMDWHDLQKAMQPNDSVGKTSSDYNQYGVGMKLGIFWFGKDVSIYTKKNDDIEYFLNLETTKHNKSDEVIVEAINSNKNIISTSSGTKIFINHLHNNRCFLESKGKYNFIIEGLTWRYNKLIKKGIEIKVSIIKKDGKMEEKTIDDSWSLPAYKKDDLFDDEAEDAKTLEQRKEKYEQLIKNIQKNINNEKVNSLKNVFFNKLVENEELVYEKDLNINNKVTKLKFGILKKINNLSKYSGVTLYHLERGILHGPNDDDNQMGNMQFVELTKGSTGDTKWRRVFGELDLTNIEEPDTNKSNFVWSQCGEEDLKKQLKEIYDELEDILDLLVKVENIKSNNSNTTQIKETTKSFNEKMLKISSNATWKASFVDDDVCYALDEIQLNNTNYRVEIIESSSDEVHFIKLKKDDEEHKLQIFIEKENKFWKPLVTKNEFKGQILLPLCLIISLAELSYDNKYFLQEINPYGDKKFIEIMGEIINKWI